MRDWLAHRPILWTKPGLIRRGTLLVRRSPWVAVAALLGAAACGAMAMVAVGNAQAARQANELATKNAELLKSQIARAEIDADRIKLTRTVIRTIREGMLKGPVGDSLDGWLPMLSMLDSIDPAGFTNEGQPGPLTDSWDKRIELADAKIERLRAIHGSETFEVLGWKMCRGLWLMQSRRYDEAFTALDDNVRGWTAFVRVDDPWLRVPESLRDVCRVLQLAERTTEPPPGELARELQALDERLSADMMRTTGSEMMDSWSSRGLAVLRLHPRLLNRADERDQWSKKLGSIFLWVRDRMKEPVGTPNSQVGASAPPTFTPPR